MKAILMFGKPWKYWHSEDPRMMKSFVTLELHTEYEHVYLPGEKKAVPRLMTVVKAITGKTRFVYQAGFLDVMADEVSRMKHAGFTLINIIITRDDL